MSLAAPSIILDDARNVNMVIGAAGGKYISTALSQVNNRIYFIDISSARNGSLFLVSPVTFKFSHTEMTFYLLKRLSYTRFKAK